MGVTFIAGMRAHSLALLSESGHNVSDFLALLLSFAAVYFHTRPADDARTFGYQRAGVLAAFINAGTPHRDLGLDRPRSHSPAVRAGRRAAAAS